MDTAPEDQFLILPVPLIELNQISETLSIPYDRVHHIVHVDMDT